MSALPDDVCQPAVVVLEIPERGMIPCLCPVSLLDKPTVEAGKILTKELNNKLKVMFGRSMHNLLIRSMPVHRGNVRGHLLLTGPKPIRGRVVDTRMLTSLTAGCLRIGAHSERAFYPARRGPPITPPILAWNPGGRRTQQSTWRRNK